jgi:hypothetical protein
MSIIITYDGGIDYGNVVGTSSALPAGVNSTYFFVAWTGWLVPSVSGLYTLGVNSKDGANISICGVDMLMHLGDTSIANSDGSYTQSFQIMLTAGTYYDIEVDFQHGGADGAGSPPANDYQIQLLWTPPLGSPEVIPAECLTHYSYQMSYNLWGQWANGVVGDGTGSGWYPVAGSSSGGSGGGTGPTGPTGPAGPAPTGSGNKVIATPADGSSGVSALRVLVAADIPSLSYDAAGAAAAEASRAETAEGLLAPKNSPALTGTPTTPDVAALDDGEHIANTKYVDSAIAVGAPSPGSTVSTSNDSYTAGQVRTYSLTMAKSFLIWRVTEATGKKFRLRLYSTSAARTADATRSHTIPLTLGTQHGCILDLYINQSQAVTPFMLSPVVLGANNDGNISSTQATTVYAAIDSVEATTQNISAVISYVALES